MDKRKSYTEQDVNKILGMREAGKTWVQVADEMGRHPKALYAKFAKMRRAGALPKRKYKARVFKHSLAPEPVAAPKATRPMIAIIGEPKEIADTLQGLFS